ncbi:MAG: hypothetical protein ACWA41_01740 [Putridiphycobacter sp.]
MKFLFLLMFVFFAFPIFSQDEEERNRIIEKRIEFIGENIENSDIDLTTYLEDLYFYYDNPINLNATNFEELSKLMLLTDNQIYGILNYRKQYHQILTIYELTAIPELDEMSIEMILPFVSVQEIKKEQFNFKKGLTYGHHDIFLRYQRGLEKKAGYLDYPDSILAESPNKVYQGSPDKLYTRYRYTYKNNVSWGLTGEKDAGEEFFKGTNTQGFDFYSAHFMLSNLGKVNKLVVGDFQANFGQGLTMWSGFNLSKTANVLNVKRYAKGLKAYTSVNETNFLRGVGATVQFDLKSKNVIDFTAFGSRKKIDANINVGDTLFGDSFEGISSFQVSGFHRTLGEIEDENAVTQTIIGGATHFKSNNFKVGLVGVSTIYDKPLSTSSQTYNKFGFSGTTNFSMGVNYSYYRGKMSVFGETTLSQNQSIATLNGLTWHADPRLDVVLLHRFIDKRNQSLYSTAFGGSSQNENGIYVGAKAKISKRLNISAYYDQFTHSWLKWLTDGPSFGRDILVQADYKINYYSSFYIRFKNKVTQRNSKADVEGVKPQVFLEKTNLRFHYVQQISRRITLKSRIELIRFNYDTAASKGVMLYQDLVYSFKKIPLRISARYAIFDTDNYDTRIYAYENDLLYVFSIPSYYYKGMRTYIMAKYEFSDRVDFWVRWGVYSYVNQTEISSGLEQIEGSKKSDIKLQLKIRL